MAVCRLDPERVPRGAHLRAFGSSGDVQKVTKFALGIALLIATAGLLYRSYLRMVTKAKVRAGTLPAEPPGDVVITPRPLPTVIVGALGGVIVGMTSVGSGSLIIIAMLSLYPAMKAGGLVGTDLVQAVPLVMSAALGHILFGDFQVDLTLSLLLGCLPGVYLGARLSAYAPDGIVRRALTFVLLASALKLLGASNCSWWSSWRQPSSCSRCCGPGCAPARACRPGRGSSRGSGRQSAAPDPQVAPTGAGADDEAGRHRSPLRITAG